MRRYARIIAGIVVVMASAGVLAADAGLKSALESINPGQVLEHIKVLASDDFEGRGPGTPGEDKTVAYLTAQFQKMGLKPGNPDGTFVQNVPLVGFQAKQVTERSRPAAGRSGCRSPNDFVAVSRRLAEEVKVEKSDVVFVGYGVVAPEYGWDDYKGLDVRGKTLIMLVNDPPVPDPKDPAKLDPAVFKGRAMTYYGRWTYKYEIASEKGATAAILVHETGPAGYPFEVVRGSWSRENFDIAQPQSGQTPSRVAVEGWITLDEGQGTVPGGGPRLRCAETGRRPPRFPAGAARQLGAVSRSPTRCARSSRATSSPGSRGPIRALKNEVVDLHRALGPPGPRPGAEGRSDLQRSRRQRLRGRLDPRNRPRSGPGQAGPEAIDPVPGRHRRGEGTARCQVLRGASALSAGTHAGRHQPRRDQPLGADQRLDQHRHGQLDARRPAGRDRRESTAERSLPTPTLRKATTSVPTTSSSPSKACRRSIPRGPAIHRQVGRLRPAKAGRIHGQGLSQGQRRGEARLGPFRAPSPT